MKKKGTWKIRLAAFCLAGTCLAAGAVALAAGDQSDPLVTLSYLTEKFLPDLEKSTQEKADAKSAELTKQFEQLAGQSGTGGSASYQVVTLSAGQRMNLGLGAEVMLRVGSATAGAAVNPALVDTTTGGNLNSGGALVQNHLYMATMTDHYITAGSGTVKVMVRGSFSLS